MTKALDHEYDDLECCRRYEGDCNFLVTCIRTISLLLLIALFGNRSLLHART